MKTRNTQKGQALAEFALVFPVFMLILFGVIEVGRYVYFDNALSQAAREGARLAAVEARWIADTGIACVAAPDQITAGNPGAHVCPATTAAFKAHVTDAVNRMVVGLGTVSTVYIGCTAKGTPAPGGAWTDTTVTFPNCGGVGAPNATGDLVSVRIVYEYQPILPLIGPSQKSASASMTVN
jgi:Flp pilus assembly protein TadG